jgi:membrane protease YdiL (CAAX protease family)
MDFIKRHPVPTYFVLTFAISWVGFLAVVGPGVFTDTSWQTDPRFPLAVLAMLAGPAVTGLLLREMGSRLVRWRVDVRWYVMALVPAPVLAAAGLLALSITSPIFIADNKVVVLILGISAVPMTVLEEVGWTGFAVPRLRLRYSALTTGLIVGVFWGAWHLLQQLAISGTYAG